MDLSAPPQTGERFLTEWLESTARLTIRPKMHHSDVQLIRLHIVSALGRVQRVKLTAQYFEWMMADMTARGLSQPTVQCARAVLRRALRYTLKGRLVARNVAMLVDRCRPVQHETRFLLPAQARAHLATVGGDRLEAL